MIFSFHLTYQLQLLDIDFFSLLASNYSTKLGDLMHKSLGIVSISKQLFWAVFYLAWEVAFTESNITSVPTVIDIFPYNLEIVLIKITRPITSSNKLNLTLTLKTPLSSHAIHKATHML